MKYAKDDLQKRLGAIRHELARRQVIQEERLMKGSLDSCNPIRYDFEIEELKNMEMRMLTILHTDYGEDSGFKWEPRGFNLQPIPQPIPAKKHGGGKRKTN